MSLPAHDRGKAADAPRWSVFGFGVLGGKIVERASCINSINSGGGGFCFGCTLCRRKQQIGQAEILGAVVPSLSLPELLAGRDIFHYIDNTSAASAIISL